MKRQMALGLAMILAWLLLSCAPAATPPPAAPAPQAPAPAPAASPEDAAWAKVVQAAKKEGFLTIYSFYFSADIGRAIAKAFQEQYGIRVEILVGPGRQTVEKIKVEQRIGSPIADVLNTGTSSATEASVAGLMESVWKELPALRDKSVFKADPIYSPSGDILWFSIQVSAPYINYNLVKPLDEFRSYHDLLDPKWKGKIITTDPRGGGSGMFSLITTMRFYKVLDDDYFRRLARQELKLWGGSTIEEHKMVARGEYPMGMQAGNHTAAPLIAEGAPLKLLPMVEGVSATGESIGVVKGASHPNAARLFMNWMFSPQGQLEYARASSTTPLRKDVTDFLHPGARIKPTKIWPRTWQTAEAGNEAHKAGLFEQIFGKK